MGRKQYVSGFREAEKVLKELPVNVQNRVLQSAVRSGATAIAREVRRAAPRGEGRQSQASRKFKRLRLNIRVQNLKKKRRRGQRGSRVWTNAAFWGYIYEFGSARQPARPWFRPAFERTEKVALERITQSLAKGIDREAEKLAKKYRVARR